MNSFRSFNDVLNVAFNEMNALHETEVTMLQEEITALKEQLHALQQEHPGHVVLTKRGDTDELILVSRQDDEGHILSVLWEKPEPIRTETPTQMMDDVANFATKHLPLD